LRSKIPALSASSGDAPLVFIHYGPAVYLRLALRCARRSNPGKSFFFLGDETNLRAAHGLAEAIPFNTLGESVSLRRFEQVFQPIQGCRHRFNKLGGTEFWLKFVFKRWFLIREFLERFGLDCFWTFDSDTLVFAPLGIRQRRFSSYEATSQCRDRCLNGFIGSRLLVERYTSFMLRLFSDEDFLERQRARLAAHPGLAFNEMDAFCEFRRQENVQTFHAARPLEGEFFDDALAYDADFEASPHQIGGRISVKRLWQSPDGAIYAKHLESAGYVRMVTCNLSWLPDYVGKKLSRFCLTPEQDASVRPPIEEELREVDLSQPWTDKIATVLRRRVFELKRTLGR